MHRVDVYFYVVYSCLVRRGWHRWWRRRRRGEVREVTGHPLLFSFWVLPPPPTVIALTFLCSPGASLSVSISSRPRRAGTLWRGEQIALKAELNTCKVPLGTSAFSHSHSVSLSLSHIHTNTHTFSLSLYIYIYF